MTTGRLRPHGSTSVSIHVRDLAQMFNSLDPSPFWDRDLDRDAAEFIEDEFGDRRWAARWQLHVRTAHTGDATAADVQAAIERYYERLAVSTRLNIREQMRVGEIALLAGIAVFSICTSLRGILQQLLHVLPRAIDEGLIILAWVALWRPIEGLAYGWVPLYRKRRLYQRLARIQVSVHNESTPVTGSHTLGQVPKPVEPRSGS